MRISIVLASIVLAATAMLSPHASAQTCLRPKWTECVAFPNGGRHTGIDAYGKPVQAVVPPGSNICVSTEWEISADTFALFQRNGIAWPSRDWEVEVDTFCFYKN